MFKEKWEVVKDHVSRHKEAYITGGFCLVVGVIIGAETYHKVSVSQKSQNIGLLNWKTFTHMEQNTIVLEVPARGHRGNVLVDENTGHVYPSQNEAARELGVSPSSISQHLNGHRDHVGGITLKKMGENLSEKVQVSV
jgi:DNA endonuclease I-HmuI-like, NUMOD-like domain